MWWIQLYIQASIFMSYCEMKSGSFSHLQEQENVALVDLAQTQSNHYSLHCCCCYCCQVTSVVSDSVRPHRQQPTRLPSLGFSRQEHWSGLPFPSPVHESEKWKWSHSVVSDCATPMDCSLPGSSVPWDFPGKSTGVGRHCLLCEKLLIQNVSSLEEECYFSFNSLLNLLQSGFHSESR